jgi:hypothetical protein
VSGAETFSVAHTRVPVRKRRRKTVDLATAKLKFGGIFTGRLNLVPGDTPAHQALRSSITAHQAALEAAPTPGLAWAQAQFILNITKGLLPPRPLDDPFGCCTYTVDGQTFMLTMTETECGMLDGSSFKPGVFC